jgi:hypothetical protein
MGEDASDSRPKPSAMYSIAVRSIDAVCNALWVVPGVRQFWQWFANRTVSP